LIRSSRRTISIEIKPDLTVVVRAPRRAPEREIEKIVAGKEEWIHKHGGICFFNNGFFK